MLNQAYHKIPYAETLHFPPTAYAAPEAKEKHTTIGLLVVFLLLTESETDKSYSNIRQGAPNPS